MVQCHASHADHQGTITRGGAGGLNEPLPVAQVVKTQLLGDLCSSHGLWQVLLVGLGSSQAELTWRTRFWGLLGMPLQGFLENNKIG